MRHPFKINFLYILLILTFVLGAQILSQGPKDSGEIRWGELMAFVEGRQLEEIKIQGQNIQARFKEDAWSNIKSDPDKKKLGQDFKVIGPLEGIGETLRTKLEKLDADDADFKFVFLEEEKESFLQRFIISWLPMIILLVIFFMFMRQLQGSSGRAMSFGKSRARLLNENQKKITFDDVAGVEEAKEELEEVVLFLKNPHKFTKLGGRIPKGVLLMGPPGTGKTLLARGVAGEADVPFFSISGSDFVEMFVGVGASRVRDLFEQAKKNSPCIIFIDEIDAVGRQRGAGLGGGHDEREQTLNQLLVEMDGFEHNEGVILIAATNRPDVLDPALLRPGRFDRRVVVNRPDVRGREQILRVHVRKVPLSDECEMEVIAKGTPGFSGADLENLVNEAALLAARNDQDYVRMNDFEAAKDKVMMGTERRSMIISDREKETTAYHEAGHAIVAALLPGTDPVHKVTIIPRGRALGVTQQLPSEDRLSMTKDFAEKRIAILMGGRIAEEIKFDQLTTGAGQDIEMATDTARNMVCNWGMSKKLGPISFGQKNEQVFLGRGSGQSAKNYSEQTAQDIDAEINRIITEGYDRAYELLNSNLPLLESMAKALLDRETIDSHEIALLVKGEELPPVKSTDKKETRTPSAEKEMSQEVEKTQDQVTLSEASKNPASNGQEESSSSVSKTVSTEQNITTTESKASSTSEEQGAASKPDSESSLPPSLLDD